jgi:hypothetical protein
VRSTACMGPAGLLELDARRAEHAEPVPVGQLLRPIAAVRGLLPCTAARTAHRSTE